MLSQDPVHQYIGAVQSHLSPTQDKYVCVNMAAVHQGGLVSHSTDGPQQRTRIYRVCNNNNKISKKGKIINVKKQQQ